MVGNTPEVGTHCWFIVRTIKVGGNELAIQENITIMVVSPHQAGIHRRFIVGITNVVCITLAIRQKTLMFGNPPKVGTSCLYIVGIIEERCFKLAIKENITIMADNAP